METTCTVRAKFNGTHRLAGRGIPCEALHGHYYEVDFTFAANSLDSGMIVEFEDAEARVQKWLDDNWHHNIILSDSDKELGETIAKFTGQNVFYYNGIPTAENLAAYLLNEICPELFADTNGKCMRIKLTEYSKAVYSCEVSL